jgi:hemerythrin-like metal-binding protein
MDFILWRNAFSVGDPLIDTQHQKLVKIINLLYDEISSRKNTVRIQDIFKELVAYTNYHFSAEETIMTKHQYSGYPEHKKAHTAFIAKIDSLKLTTILSDDKAKMEVFKFLKLWLVDHIQNTDKITFRNIGNNLLE